VNLLNVQKLLDHMAAKGVQACFCKAVFFSCFIAVKQQFPDVGHW
jgi:hypothetical protein